MFRKPVLSNYAAKYLIPPEDAICVDPPPNPLKQAGKTGRNPGAFDLPQDARLLPEIAKKITAPYRPSKRRVWLVDCRTALKKMQIRGTLGRSENEPIFESFEVSQPTSDSFRCRRAPQCEGNSRRLSRNPVPDLETIDASERISYGISMNS